MTLRMFCVLLSPSPASEVSVGGQVPVPCSVPAKWYTRALAPASTSVSPSGSVCMSEASPLWYSAEVLV